MIETVAQHSGSEAVSLIADIYPHTWPMPLTKHGVAMAIQHGKPAPPAGDAHGKRGRGDDAPTASKVRIIVHSLY